MSGPPSLILLLWSPGEAPKAEERQEEAGRHKHSLVLAFKLAQAENGLLGPWASREHAPLLTGIRFQFTMIHS